MIFIFTNKIQELILILKINRCFNETGNNNAGRPNN